MMPFAGGIAAPENGTLVLAAAAALLYLVQVERPPSLRRTLVKGLSTALLAALAAIAGGPWLLVVALALSVVGDVLLAQEGEGPFLAGLVAFLLAHVAFAATFLMVGDGVAAIGGARIAIAVAMTVLAAAMIVRLRPAVGASLRLPVTAYAVAILAMGLAALSVPAWAVPLGALLFMASDALLAARRFLVAAGSPARQSLSLAVWTLYWLGQALITLGLVIA